MPGYPAGIFSIFFPKRHTIRLVAWLKGIKIKGAMGDGGTWGGGLREMGITFESVELNGCQGN